MTKYLISQLEKITKYTPPLKGRRKTDAVLLDFNERTLPPSKKVADSIKSFILENKIQLYPEYDDICSQIAKYSGVASDQVLITNGSDEALNIIFRSFTKKNDKVVVPTPSFSMFFNYAKICGNKIISPSYSIKSGFPLKEVLSSIKIGVKIVVVCNPNNPTGTLLPIKEIKNIAIKAKSVGAIVLVDEAYFEFSNITAVKLISSFDNLLITRTFSKAFGLASLRIGYVLGNKNLIKDLQKVVSPYSVNMVAKFAAASSLKNLNDVKKYAYEVMTISKPLLEKALIKKKIPFFKSAANFLFLRKTPLLNPYILFKNNILTRSFGDDFFRITIGTVNETKKLINILSMEKYAFLDRDGTLIFEPQDDYKIDSIEKLRILPGVIDGVKKLQNAGFKLVIVSNQNGIGTKDFPEENFKIPQKRMMYIFAENGIKFEKVFVCPHLPEDKCDCRKPKIGLLKDFLKNINLDMKNSFVAGDRITDKEFADNLGLKYLKMPLNGDFSEVINQIEL